MKNKNILILIISFIILLVACSALSMSAVASNYRYTWVAMNPWNGVEGIAFTVGYFLHTGKTVSMLITIGLLLESGGGSTLLFTGPSSDNLHQEVNTSLMHIDKFICFV